MGFGWIQDCRVIEEAPSRQNPGESTDSGTTTYTYHDNNWLETLTNPNSEVTTWAYTNIGRVDTLSLNSGSVTTHAYDSAGQTTGITHKKANDTIIERLTYTYDNAGNRLTVTENNNDVVTWTYDNANQLTAEERSGDNAYHTTFTYDDVGNRETMVDSSGTTTYTYNAGNRLTLITDPDSTLTTNTYDDNGNLTVTNNDGTRTTHTWDYDNRLRTVTLAGPATTTFTYDGDGLRRQTQTAAGTTKFVWDGQDVLLETDASNNTQVTYTQTPAVYGQMVSQRRDSTTSFYHHDALGSTLALTDANENVTDTYRYYAFGDSLTSSGNTVNNLRFVGNLGYYNEAALSLQYLRARYYQPGTGRFVSVDPQPGYPIDPVTLHKYLYAANSAPNIVDPTGLFWAQFWVWLKGLPMWLQRAFLGLGLASAYQFFMEYFVMRPCEEEQKDNEEQWKREFESAWVIAREGDIAGCIFKCTELTKGKKHRGINHRVCKNGCHNGGYLPHD